jgi:predicted AAA+ superfamily ATPase
MKDIIKAIITELQEKKLPDNKPRKLQIPVNLPLIVSLIGARRSGKTYLLFSVIQKLIDSGVSRKKIVYLNFEDERLNLRTSDLDLILQSFCELYPDFILSDCYFLFDEIQNIEGWEKFIRRMFDTQSKNIFISGSNSKLLSTEIATSLRGRTVAYTIFPLCLEEYLQFKNISIDWYHPQKRAKLIHCTIQFITQGGFPEVINFENDIRLKVLQSYFNTMIYRDIIERYKVSDPTILKFFIKKIFAAIGKPLSINKIYNDLRSLGYKISNNYLYNFEEYCFTIFLGISVPKFHFSEIKQEKADKKVYSIDTGLLSSVEFSMSENKGKLLENMVLLEFIKLGYSVFYFKEKYECDFIIKNENKLLPIQVSWLLEDNKTKDREIRGLIEACNKVSANEGIIITFDQKDEFQQQGINIKLIPVYQYFLKREIE